MNAKNVLRTVSVIILCGLLMAAASSCGPRNSNSNGNGNDGTNGADARADGGADASVDGADTAEPIVCSDASSGKSKGGRCKCGDHTCGRHTSCEAKTQFCVTEAEGSCKSKGSWSKGTKAFADASKSWKLPAINAHGVRISVTDLEGDGWPDLAVRRVKNLPNKKDKRMVWLLRNTGNGTFKDVTDQTNLLATRELSSTEARPAQIMVWGDVDNDGDLDAYTGFNKEGSYSTNSAEIMLNKGDGTFELTAESNAVRQEGSADIPGGATFVDYNRDGNLDLWVTQYGTGQQVAMQDHLYRGNGDGSFEDVTEEVGIDTVPWKSSNISKMNRARGHSRSWGSNACDLNGDGTPELLASSYGRAPNHLWRATRKSGAVTYDNISLKSDYAFDDGMDWTTNVFAQCYCDKNPNAAKCDKAPKPTSIDCSKVKNLSRRWRHQVDRQKFRLGGNTGTTLCTDFDRDGQLDLLTNEIRHWWAGSNSDPSQLLYNTKGDKIRFERADRSKTGLSRQHSSASWDEGDITSGSLDFDNDARPDFYIGSTDYPGTRGLLYHQKSDGTFEKVPISEGIDHKSSHGIALADFDRDGDVDVVAGHSDNRCKRGNHCYPEGEHHVRLFENKMGQDRNWLQLKLVGGDGSNRSAIGARVTVKTDNWQQVQEVDGGHGHYGIQHDLTLHFGLGEACRARVKVRWPDESLTTQTFVLKSGHRYRLKQGTDPIVADVN